MIAPIGACELCPGKRLAGQHEPAALVVNETTASACLGNLVTVSSQWSWWIPIHGVARHVRLHRHGVHPLGSLDGRPRFSGARPPNRSAA
jgi:hypothetical protein